MVAPFLHAFAKISLYSNILRFVCFFQDLALPDTEALEQSQFFLNNQKRCRLLLRIHLAHLRQEAQTSSVAENSCFVTPVKEEGGKVGARSGSELLTEASMSMSLAILETLGPFRKCLLPLCNK